MTPTFDDFKTEAEDMAFETTTDKGARSLILRIASAELLETEMMMLAKIIAAQIEIPTEAVQRDIRMARLKNLKMSGSDTTSAALEAFLGDSGACLLGDPKTHYTRRPAFFRAYQEWCRQHRMIASGKTTLYEQLHLPSIVKLGLRGGTDARGNDIVRGVMLADEEM